MPTKLYKIIGEDGKELHGNERKKELDKRLRQKKKEEKQKNKEEEKTEEEEEEEEINTQNEETESILEYPSIKQPKININNTSEDYQITEEEIQKYIREKEQKNAINPPVSQQVQPQQNSLFNTILTGLITTSITTLVPIGLLIGIQKFSASSQTVSDQPKSINLPNGTQKREFKQFTTFTPPN